MKLAFAGTPTFAATILDGFLSSPHEVGLVISQPNPRKGRGRKTVPTPVAELARSADLPLLQPARIGDAADDIARHDVLVVAAYGQILRPDTLHATRLGAYNVHASLLPEYRGAAPVERAIMAGERETGVTIMRMDAGLDTGPTALRRPVEITPDVTGGELTALLASAGSKAVVEAMALLEFDNLTLTEQDSSYATYAAKISDQDREIRWEREAGRVHDLVRALAPHVGARTLHPEVEGAVKIWRSRVADEGGVTPGAGHIYAEHRRIFVGCGVGAIEVLELQLPGAKRLPARDFLAGNTLGGTFFSGTDAAG